MEHLNLTNNGLTGRISVHLAGLTRLKTLDLSKNKLKSSIEPVVELSGVYKCEDTDSTTSDAMYHRKCDKDFECGGGKCVHMGGLSEVWLQDNLLTGTIPQKISNLYKTLKIFDASVNKLSGELPKELGLCRELHELNLFFNRITGAIPRSWGLLKKMRFMSLSTNHLSGRIPEELANMARLEQLDLSYNKFGGTIPNKLGVLTSPRTTECDRPGGSCFGSGMSNLTLGVSKGVCEDGQLMTTSIFGYKQPCMTGDPDPRWICKSCQKPYPSGGRSNTLDSPAADCHEGLPEFPGAPDVSADARYRTYPWAPAAPVLVKTEGFGASARNFLDDSLVVQEGIGPSLRIIVLRRCTRSPSLYAREPPGGRVPLPPPATPPPAAPTPATTPVPDADPPVVPVGRRRASEL